MARLAEDLERGTHGQFPSPPKSAATIILASDFYAPLADWQARLAPLAAKCPEGVLLAISAPIEESFPFEGRTKLSRPGTESDTAQQSKRPDAVDTRPGGGALHASVPARQRQNGLNHGNENTPHHGGRRGHARLRGLENLKRHGKARERMLTESEVRRRRERGVRRH